MSFSDEKVPQLALGTWLMGGTKEPDPENDDEKDISIIRLAVGEGITLIDTAQNYAAGKCEELVGQAIRSYARDSYQILTKQDKNFLSYEEVLQGCQASLERMGLDYIDYFVCHAPNTDFDMRDFFKATNLLYKQGLIRHVGVSNFGPKMLQIAVDTSNIPISLNQVHFSLTDGDVLDTGTYDFCVKHSIAIQAYRPLLNIRKNEGAMKALDPIAKSRNLSIEQAAIAYLNSYKNMTFTIRASSKAHWDEIKTALKIKLGDDEIDKLRYSHFNKQGAFREYLLT